MPYVAPIVPKELREQMRRSNSRAIHRALQAQPAAVTAIPPWEEVSDAEPDESGLRG